MDPSVIFTALAIAFDVAVAWLLLQGVRRLALGRGHAARRAARALVQDRTNFLSLQRDALPADAVAALEGAIAAAKSAARDRATPPDVLAKATRELEDASNRAAETLPRNRFAQFSQLAETVVVVLGVVMPLRAYFFQPFKIPTGSMQPTLFGIHGEDCEKPGFFDSCKPLQVLQWAFTGRWYRDVVAHEDGSLVVSTDHLRAPGYNLFTLAGETYKVPTDVLARHEKSVLRVADPTPDNPATAKTELLRGRVFKGDRLWSGYVVSGDQVFVNRMLWYLRPPKRDEVTVFSTFRPTLALTTGAAADGRNAAARATAAAARGVSLFRIPLFGGAALEYGAAPIRGLPPWQFYIKRCVGLPGETVSIDPPRLLVNGAATTDCPGIARVEGMAPSVSGPAYTGYRNTGDRELGRIANPNTPLGKSGDALKIGDAYLPMGDNTVNSYDGRYWGPVPRRQLLGPGAFTYWPLSKRWGRIR